MSHGIGRRDNLWIRKGSKMIQSKTHVSRDPALVTLSPDEWERPREQKRTFSGHCGSQADVQQLPHSSLKDKKPARMEKMMILEMTSTCTNVGQFFKPNRPRTRRKSISEGHLEGIDKGWCENGIVIGFDSVKFVTSAHLTNDLGDLRISWMMHYPWQHFVQGLTLFN